MLKLMVIQVYGNPVYNTISDSKWSYKHRIIQNTNLQITNVQ